MAAGGDRPDEPAALLGAQLFVQGVLDQAVTEQTHLPGTGPADVVLVLLLAHELLTLAASGLPARPVPGRCAPPIALRPGRPERVGVATRSPSRTKIRTGRGEQPPARQHRSQPPRRA